MQRLMECLEGVLRFHGHATTRDAALEGRSGTVYTIPMLAECDERAYVVDAFLDGVVPAEVIEQLEEVCRDVGADGAVLCHLEAAETVGSDKVCLWGRDELVRLIGDAQLAEATDGTARPPVMEAKPKPDAPVAESLSDLLPPAFKEPERTGEAPMTTVDLDALEGLGDGFLDDIAPAEPAPDQAPSIPGPDAPEPAVHPLLPVRVLPEEAKAMVRERLFDASHLEMVLQPVHLVDYECDLLAEGSLRYDTVSGRLQVHGTDKHVIEVDPDAIDPDGFTKLPRDEPPRNERVLRVSDERAKERSRSFLVEAHTRLVDVQVEDNDGSYSYTEKKHVAPRPDHIRLHPLGVYHRVLWRVHGPNGHVDVDAITGALVEQRLQTPDPGTIMLD